MSKSPFGAIRAAFASAAENTEINPVVRADLTVALGATLNTPTELIVAAEALSSASDAASARSERALATGAIDIAIAQEARARALSARAVELRAEAAQLAEQALREALAQLEENATFARVSREALELAPWRASTEILAWGGSRQQREAAIRAISATPRTREADWARIAQIFELDPADDRDVIEEIDAGNDGPERRAQQRAERARAALIVGAIAGDPPSGADIERLARNAGLAEIGPAILLAALDVVGVGGRRDLSGAASARIPALSGIAARKHAQSGAAWSAAIRSALATLIERARVLADVAPEPRPVVWIHTSIEDGMVGLDIRVGATLVAEFCECAVLGADSARWLSALSRLLLSRVGMNADGSPVSDEIDSSLSEIRSEEWGPQWPEIRFTGETRAWARIARVSGARVRAEREIQTRLLGAIVGVWAASPERLDREGLDVWGADIERAKHLADEVRGSRESLDSREALVWLSGDRAETLARIESLSHWLFELYCGERAPHQSPVTRAAARWMSDWLSGEFAYSQHAPTGALPLSQTFAELPSGYPDRETAELLGAAIRQIAAPGSQRAEDLARADLWPEIGEAPGERPLLPESELRAALARARDEVRLAEEGEEQAAREEERAREERAQSPHPRE